MRVVDDRADAAGTGAVRPAPAAGAGRRCRPRLLDLAVLASFLLLATVVLAPYWADPHGRILIGNEDDHGFFLFVLAHAERVVFHLENPLFTARLNAPDGVNMMANTSVLALALPVAPVTHLFGPGVSLALLLTLGLAGTAAAWYRVLDRHLVRSRAAAYVGGLWCGFAPTMVSHAHAHVNFVAQFVVPFLVWRVLRLREPGRAVPNGVALGLLIVLQVFINEEVLLFTALGFAVFVAAYAAFDRAGARAAFRPFVAGLGVAAGLASVLLAYPLWFQFFGPQHYRGQPFDAGEYVTDLAAFGAYARQSLAGHQGVAERLSVSPTEDNAFFGVPVLVLLAVSVAVLWRSAAARATAVTALVFAIVSMGPTLVVAGFDTGIPLPFALASRIPVLDLISVTRFTMVTSVLVGVLLALGADRFTAAGVAGRQRTRRVRVGFWVALVAALVPVTPKPLPVVPAEPLPAFLAENRWRPYVPPGRTIVPVPLPEVTYGRQGMRWAALTGLEFAVPGGYFMGPAGPDDDTGSWRPAARPTAALLHEVAQGGPPPAVGPAERRAAAADLAYWRAAVVVVGGHPRRAELAATLTALLEREPVADGGVLLWDVRDVTG